MFKLHNWWRGMRAPVTVALIAAAAAAMMGVSQFPSFAQAASSHVVVAETAAIGPAANTTTTAARSNVACRVTATGIPLLTDRTHANAVCARSFRWRLPKVKGVVEVVTTPAGQSSYYALRLPAGTISKPKLVPSYPARQTLSCQIIAGVPYVAGTASGGRPAHCPITNWVGAGGPWVMLATPRMRHFLTIRLSLLRYKPRLGPRIPR